MTNNPFSTGHPTTTPAPRRAVEPTMTTTTAAPPRPQPSGPPQTEMRAIPSGPAIGEHPASTPETKAQAKARANARRDGRTDDGYTNYDRTLDRRGNASGKPGMTSVKLTHNYKPMGEYEVVSQSDQVAGTASRNKLWAGSVICLPNDEATALVDRGDAVPA